MSTRPRREPSVPPALLEAMLGLPRSLRFGSSAGMLRQTHACGEIGVPTLPSGHILRDDPCRLDPLRTKNPSLVVQRPVPES